MENTKEKNIKQVGLLETSLIKDIDKYISLVNKGRPKGSKIKRIDLVRDYFKEILKDTVLNNDYITLKEPLYFNIETLIKKGTVKASKEKPILSATNLQLG